jgi:shikimate kinase
MKDQRILITGLMGSGKTTVARELARQLNCDWVDLDEMIAKHEGRTPREIIEQEGEEKFRETETQMLRQVLTSGSERVVAMGGGAWTIAKNRELIAKHGAATVWLDVPFDLCWSRIGASGEKRPLAPSYGAARQRFEDRLDIYALANFRIAITKSDTAEEIAKKTAALISRYGANS